MDDSTNGLFCQPVSLTNQTIWYMLCDMFAIIKTGGKQYVVEPGKTIRIEKLPQEAGSEVVFDQVLLIENGHDIQIGTPVIAGAKVTGKVLRQGRAEKVMTIKFKAKKRSKKKAGHRQAFTEVSITNIAA